MALLTSLPEYSGMSKRGSYKKAAPVPAAPPVWRRNFLAKWRGAMTQEDLSEKSGVSVGMISSIEGQKSGYSGESLQKLADALGITKGMILDVDPTGDEELWSLVLRANPKEREQIAKHATVIVSKKGTKR